MLRTKATVYTPEQVAQMLQLSKNTVYDLIGRGEIVTKRIGKLYPLSATSLSFFFTWLDYDLYLADLKDREQLPTVQDELIKARAQM